MSDLTGGTSTNVKRAEAALLHDGMIRRQEERERAAKHDVPSLTDKIAREHRRIFNARRGLGPHCTCGWKHESYDGSQKHVIHVAEVTEQAVRELALIELEQAWRSGYYTGKRDYAGSVTGGMSISTPNPYTERIARGGTDD